MTYAIETFTTQKDSEAVHEIELDLADALTETRRIFNEEGWAKVILWSALPPDASAIKTLRRPRMRPRRAEDEVNLAAWNALLAEDEARFSQFD